MEIKKYSIAAFNALLAILFAVNGLATDLQFEDDFETPSAKLKKWGGVKLQGQNLSNL